MQDKINNLAKNNIPFLFIIGFDTQNCLVFPLEALKKQNDIFYNLNGNTNLSPTLSIKKNIHAIELKKHPIDFETYKKSFDAVIKHLTRGDSFLVNLTFQTPIEVNYNLLDIFLYSQAKYKLYFKDEFVCFSPEIFIQIKGNKIYSFPMKGTINADIPNAEQNILNDAKEHAEHATIVDLIRNDLSMVAEEVRVEAFRYVDCVRKHNGESLLQVSSRISGKLPDDWKNNLGDLLFALLPAGSICGAPKPKTLAIIKDIENYKRGFYTGIVGIFDGKNVDAGVMIRFIEQTPNGLVFKSGGGITHRSNAQKEYEELIEKIYIPI